MCVQGELQHIVYKHSLPTIENIIIKANIMRNFYSICFVYSVVIKFDHIAYVFDGSYR